jgi:hypothetical protein
MSHKLRVKSPAPINWVEFSEDGRDSAQSYADSIGSVVEDTWATLVILRPSQSQGLDVIVPNPYLPLLDQVDNTSLITYTDLLPTAGTEYAWYIENNKVKLDKSKVHK